MRTSLTAEQQALVDQGLAIEYNGRLIPIVRGGDPSIDPIFPETPEDFAALSAEELAEFVSASEVAAASVHADPSAFVNDERDQASLLAEMRDGVAALESAREELAAREPAPTEDEFAAELAELAARAETDEPDGDEPDDDPVEPEAEAAADTEELAVEPEPETTPDAPQPAATVTAAAPARRRPARSPSARPTEREQAVSLVAAAPNLGYDIGAELPDLVAAAEMMMQRRRNFGNIPPGTAGEKIPIATANWSDLYPEERRLGKDEETNMALVAAATNQRVLRAELERRLKGALVASGGLCAPVTPYYQLQVISSAMRPVRAALPAFNAERGGIRYARPAALSAVTTGVGYKTVAEDGAGGSEAVKTCQVVPCPPFTETDIAIIFHCLQFGNVGSRTFPELVAQWNQLTMAAHARLAETALLDGIESASTAVTASDLGLGASATLPSQIITAAAGMRSRNRMDPEAILRVLLPDWSLDLLVSDMYRTQFDRFDMGEREFIALLRANGIEPSFYIDGSTAGGQVFGPQGVSDLVPFPETVEWFLYPEGSFIFVDGGMLELGLVRDSVLNSTNDFQIFGESFENVAYVGVESLAVTTTVCDSGAVSLPIEVTTCGDYS